MQNPIGQIKDLYRLQKEARQMQRQMRAVKISGMSDDELIEIIIDGTQEIQDIFIDNELLSVDRKNDLIKGIKHAMKDAQKKLQKEMMKDIDIGKMKSMMGI